MKFTTMGLFAALALVAMPLALPAQALADPSGPPGKCHLAPTMTMQKTKAGDCGSHFVAGTPVSKVKTVERVAKGDSDNVITSGVFDATFNPPADPVVEKLKSGGKAELTIAYEPTYKGEDSDRLFVCTGGGSAAAFESGVQAVNTELRLGRQPCQRRASAW